jgi:hypothetical protein
MSAIDNPVAAPRLPDEGWEWPSPVSDADILWLEPGQEPKAVPAPAVVQTRAALTLAQLLASGVTFEWQDAVTIVLALADEFVPEKASEPIGGVPPFEAILLQSDGRFHAQADRSNTETVTVGFGSLLRRLLQDKPAPANLWLLAWATSDAGASMSLEQLVGELAQWEDPDAGRKLVDLYERGRVAVP